MKLLSPADRRAMRCGPDHVAVGLFEHPDGVIFWEKLALTDAPNDLVGHDDLEGVVVDIVDGSAAQQGEAL